MKINFWIRLWRTSSKAAFDKRLMKMAGLKRILIHMDKLTWIRTYKMLLIMGKN